MDELERRLRAARPISGHRRLPLTDRAKRELAELMLTNPELDPNLAPAMRRVRRRRAGVIVAAAAATIIAAVPIIGTLTLTPAYAATPPMLNTTSVHGEAQDVLEELSDVVIDTSPEPSSRNVQINVQTWTLQADEDGTATMTVVVPHDYAITRGPDGSRTMIVTAGQPIDADGGEARGDTVPEAGELLWEQRWHAGEYLPLYPDPLPERSDELEAFFAKVIGGEAPPTAAQVIPELNSLLLEQKLSPPQEAALLRYLSALPDLKIFGSTKDRLGREGIVITAPGVPDYEQRIILSPSAGQILATETIYTGETRTDIASPSVISYYAWNRTPQP